MVGAPQNTPPPAAPLPPDSKSHTNAIALWPKISYPSYCFFNVPLKLSSAATPLRLGESVWLPEVKKGLASWVGGGGWGGEGRGGSRGRREERRPEAGPGPPGRLADLSLLDLGRSCSEMTCHSLPLPLRRGPLFLRLHVSSQQQPRAQTFRNTTPSLASIPRRHRGGAGALAGQDGAGEEGHPRGEERGPRATGSGSRGGTGGPAGGRLTCRTR